jgi:benzoyl-CoA 2,3-dioxygenase component B
VRNLGVIDLPTIQKKANLHYSLSLDLFGSEVSTNAANAFNAGIKGRFMETKIDDDHKLHGMEYTIRRFVDGQMREENVPALSAINMRLRDDYVKDAAGGVKRWNAAIKKTGIEFELTLPHEGFNRKIGEFSTASITPNGDVISAEEWGARQNEWLPSTSDGDYIKSLMVPVTEAGQYASWIAPPRMGIDNKPGDFEYVQLHMA